jgi:GNAT superfamily N-acetyltransferase
MIDGPDGRTPMTTTVQVAGRDDTTALAELRHLWTAETWDMTDDVTFGERFSRWVAAPRGDRTFWIARDGGRPVGMVNMFVVERMPRPGRPDSRWGYLGNLFVVAGHRRAGVATRLVEALLAAAADRGLEHVVVHPNEQSGPFWRHSLFEPSDLLVHRLP